jgi:hypothetical protein
MNEFSKTITRVESEKSFPGRKLLLEEFIKDTRASIKHKNDKDQFTWLVAIHHLTPILEQLEGDNALTTKDCDELKHRLKYEGQIGLPENSPQPLITALAIRLADSFCSQKN